MTHRRPFYTYLYRSSITGKFVTREYAEANPETTLREGKYHPGKEAPCRS